MRSEYEQSYASKFTHPFAAYLYEVSLHGGADEDSGESDSPTGWFGRFGRHLLTEDSQGFVTWFKLASVAEAETMFAALDAEYGEWLGSDEDEWQSCCEVCAGVGCQSCGWTGRGDTHGPGCDCALCPSQPIDWAAEDAAGRM